MRQSVIFAGLSVLVVSLLCLTLTNPTPVYSQFIGYPQISPANPNANQPITFTVTTTSGNFEVTFSVYFNVASTFCDTDWFDLKPSLELNATEGSGNVWSVTATEGLPAGLYGVAVFAHYPSNLGVVGSPMCTVLSITESTPVSEFNATGIITFLTIVVSLFAVRHKH